MKLFCPGPVNLKVAVEKTKVSQISHRSSQFHDIYKKATTLTKSLLNIKNDYSCLFLSGSGTLSIETMIFTFLKLKNVLIIKNGGFAEKWEKLFMEYSSNYKSLDFGWGNQFDFSEIEKQLIKFNFDYIFFVHHETTTTIINDIELLNKLGNKYNVKLAVDIVSSVGCYKIDLQKLNSVHLLGYSTNKFIGSHPGLSVNIVKNKLFNNLNSSNSYLHLKKYYEYSQINETPFTPCVNNFFYYCNALIELEKFNFNNLREVKNYLISEMSKLNYKLYIKNIDLQCNWVLNFYCKDPDNIYDKLYDNNIVIYKTKGKIRNTCIQIAIYNKTKTDIDELIKIINK